MNENIEVRELLETIYKGKWIISIITIIVILISAVISWFIIPSSYESQATIQVRSDIQQTDIMSSFITAEFTPLIFEQHIKNNSNFKKVFSENNITDEYKSENLSVSILANTDIVELSYTRSNPNVAQRELALIIETVKREMDHSVKKTLKELEKTYITESDILSNEIEALIEQYNKTILDNDLPEILMLQTILESQIIINMNESQIKALGNLSGSLQSQISQMNAEITSKSGEYRKILDKYQAVRSGVETFKAENFIRIIIEPTAPEEPSSPNKALNLVVGTLLGLIIGIFVVFFRDYWNKTSRIK